MKAAAGEGFAAVHPCEELPLASSLNYGPGITRPNELVAKLSPTGTICVYKALPDTNKFRLMAARSFKYDRFLEDFNNEALRPKDVQKLIEDQRQRQDLQNQDDQPTVDQTIKPSENLPDIPKEP